MTTDRSESIVRLIDSFAKWSAYDLSVPLVNGAPTSPTHPGFRMALQLRHGDIVRVDGGSAANELISMGGHTGTHIDALSHISVGGTLYGGVDAAAAQKGGRFAELGVETIPLRVRRGVLLDVAGYLGRTLRPAEAVGADVLAATAAAQNSVLKPGDCVLVRTGWLELHDNDPLQLSGWTDGAPGVDVSGATWLADGGASIVASDTVAFEHIAAGARHTNLPVHNLLVCDRGVHIIELANLRGLASAKAHEFVIMAFPLPLVGATGSPLRLVAFA
jgi:kynurenine formamidase